MTTKPPLALLAAVAALGLAACGGDDDKGGSALSKAELVKQADAICKDSDTKIDAVKQPTDISDANQAAPYFAEVSKVAEEQHSKLVALKPADDVKADYENFLKEEEKAFDLIEGLATAAKEKDATKGAELLKQVSANTTYEASAKKLGLKNCAG